MRNLPARARRLLRRINWAYWSVWLVALILLASFLFWRSLTANRRYFGSEFDWEWSITASGLDCVFLLWFLASGAAIGSFINVMAYRMPLGISINGISRCPYCGTSLSAFENMPIFGWFRLRGRCKTCRLPISPRYVLVELWVMVVFGVVYFTEFMTSGGNLPSQAFHHLSLEQLTMASPFVPLLLLYLWCESGLVAIALFALTRKVAPSSLVFWIILPCFLVPLVQPKVIQIDWQTWIGSFNLRFDPNVSAVTTVILGGLFGSVAATVIQAAIRAIERSFYPPTKRVVVEVPGGQHEQSQIDLPMAIDDQLHSESYLALPLESTLATENGPQPGRAGEFIACVAIAGALMGWQAVIFIAPLSVMLAGAIHLLGRRFTDLKYSSNLDPACTVWLAVLILRATWHTWW